MKNITTLGFGLLGLTVVNIAIGEVHIATVLRTAAVKEYREVVDKDFAAGWKTGWVSGWKEIKGKNTYPPYPPYGRDTYQDGYNLGFIAGMEAAKKK